MPPDHFLYLVDLATEEVVAYCSIDDRSELDILHIERQLRADAKADASGSGLAVRDSRLRPEEAARVREWIGKNRS